MIYVIFGLPKQLIIIFKFKLMIRKNNYTQMILDRLSRKDLDGKKSNLNSNQKTQATPSDSDKNGKKEQIKMFFQMWNCAVFHQPVIIDKKPPMKRCLFWELNALKPVEPYQLRKERMVTFPAQTSEFTIGQIQKNEIRRGGLSQYSRQLREIKPSVNLKRSESQVITNCKIIQPYMSVPRNKSMKTVPSSSSIISTNYRRTLVIPASKPIAREPKQQKRRYLKKCDSYQKYVMNFH